MLDLLSDLAALLIVAFFGYNSVRKITVIVRAAKHAAKTENRDSKRDN